MMMFLWLGVGWVVGFLSGGIGGKGMIEVEQTGGLRANLSQEHSRPRARLSKKTTNTERYVPSAPLSQFTLRPPPISSPCFRVRDGLRDS